VIIGRVAVGGSWDDPAVTLVMVLFTIAVVGGVSAVVLGLVSGGLAEPTSPIPVRELPAGPLTGHDVEDLRFGQALRGYRMDQVDAAMDRLAAEVDRLRSLVPESGGSGAIWESEPATGSLRAERGSPEGGLARASGAGFSREAESTPPAGSAGDAGPTRTDAGSASTSGCGSTSGSTSTAESAAEADSDLPTGRD
jgi:DivIVA domain-containing protein